MIDNTKYGELAYDRVESLERKVDRMNVTAGAGGGECSFTPSEATALKQNVQNSVLRLNEIGSQVASQAEVLNQTVNSVEHILNSNIQPRVEDLETSSASTTTIFSIIVPKVDQAVFDIVMQDRRIVLLEAAKTLNDTNINTLSNATGEMRNDITAIQESQTPQRIAQLQSAIETLGSTDVQIKADIDGITTWRNTTQNILANYNNHMTNNTIRINNMRVEVDNVHTTVASSNAQLSAMADVVTNIELQIEESGQGSGGESAGTTHYANSCDMPLTTVCQIRQIKLPHLYLYAHKADFLMGNIKVHYKGKAVAGEMVEFKSELYCDGVLIESRVLQLSHNEVKIEEYAVDRPLLKGMHEMYVLTTTTSVTTGYAGTLTRFAYDLASYNVESCKLPWEVFYGTNAVDEVVAIGNGWDALSRVNKDNANPITSDVKQYIMSRPNKYVGDLQHADVYIINFGGKTKTEIGIVFTNLDTNQLKGQSVYSGSKMNFAIYSNSIMVQTRYRAYTPLTFLTVNNNAHNLCYLYFAPDDTTMKLGQMTIYAFTHNYRQMLHVVETKPFRMGCRKCYTNSEHFDKEVLIETDDGIIRHVRVVIVETDNIYRNAFKKDIGRGRYSQMYLDDETGIYTVIYTHNGVIKEKTFTCSEEGVYAVGPEKIICMGDQGIRTKDGYIINVRGKIFRTSREYPDPYNQPLV